ncbi:unnamed protein product [Tenebrio molitor]|jgi:hypothetical protein|nr:unnamed protein product [Tenebrio molitor]
MNVELSERDKDTDKQERRKRIRESSYNREYARYMTEKITREIKIMARVGYGNEERENR